VYYKGYLNKKNEALASGKAPNRNWITYWVVLRSQFLLFFKERKHVSDYLDLDFFSKKKK